MKPSKYIDADRLKAMMKPEYDRNKAWFKKTGEKYVDGIISGLDMVEQFIDSLQQEQLSSTDKFYASDFNFDSDYELKGWEYTIPKGMFAEIKDGKIIIKQKAINDEVVDALINFFTGESVPSTPALREKCIDFLDSLRGMKMLPVFDSNKAIGDIFHIEKDGIKEAWTYMGPTIDK